MQKWFRSLRIRRINLFFAMAFSLVGAVVTAIVAAWLLAPRLNVGTQTTPPADLTRLALTIAAGVGGVVALVVAYRRQRDLEQGRFVETFGAAAKQLGATDVAVRLAGVYAMAGVADQASKLKRQQCIDVLCGYLRLPYSPELGNNHQSTLVVRKPAFGKGDSEQELQFQYRQNDKVVRQTIVRVIAAHLQRKAPHSWSSNDFDFNGSHFEQIEFGGVTFRGSSNFTAATFSGERTSFSDATFSGRNTSFTGATFSSKSTWFDKATFWSWNTSFTGATFSSKNTWFGNATFSGQTISFDEATFSGELTLFFYATFSGGNISFDNATFSGKDTRFDDVTFSGGTTRFDDATFSGERTSFKGVTFSGENTSFSKATFSGEGTPFFADIDDETFKSDGISFKGATFRGERTSFSDATFSGGTASFDNVTFSSERTSFSDATFSGENTSFRNVDSGVGKVTFDHPQTWSPAPVFDWDAASDPIIQQPANVEPQEWPPSVGG